jgi:hypothetical protein
MSHPTSFILRSIVISPTELILAEIEKKYGIMPKSVARDIVKVNTDL